jgi:hypothetical protein
MPRALSSRQGYGRTAPTQPHGLAEPPDPINERRRAARVGCMAAWPARARVRDGPGGRADQLCAVRAYRGR